MVTNTNEKMDLRTFLRTIFDRGYKSSFLSGVVNCGGFRIPDVSLGKLFDLEVLMKRKRIFYMEPFWMLP